MDRHKRSTGKRSEECTFRETNKKKGRKEGILSAKRRILDSNLWCPTSLNRRSYYAHQLLNSLCNSQGPQTVGLDYSKIDVDARKQLPLIFGPWSTLKIEYDVYVWMDRRKKRMDGHQVKFTHTTDQNAIMISITWKTPLNIMAVGMHSTFLCKFRARCGFGDVRGS